MRKIFLVVFISLIFNSFVYAEENLQAKYASYTSDKYSEDRYILLKEEEKVELEENGSYKIHEYKLYKILKEEARFSLGEMVKSYNEAFEKLTILKARTIAPDGTIQDATEFQEYNPYSGFPAYSSYRTKIASLPNVIEGSLEFREFRGQNSGDTSLNYC